MNSPKAARILTLANKAGVIRARDLAPYAIPRAYLTRLCQAGKLQRLDRGLYMLTNGDATTNHHLAQAAKRVPHGVICLLSALRFHGVATQAPSEVWMAIDHKARTPAVTETPLRIVRLSEETLHAGIDTHTIEGIPTPIHCLPKAIADCFRHRDEIGLEVAVEALRESWRARKLSINELWRYAVTGRVDDVMRPCLDALT